MIEKSSCTCTTPPKKIYIPPSKQGHVYHDCCNNRVVKTGNIAKWAKNNISLFTSLYNDYFEYDSRVVKLYSFDECKLCTEVLHGYPLNDWDKLCKENLQTLIHIHHEFVDMWNKQLNFRKEGWADNQCFYHFDWLPKNLLWCREEGRLRLIDPDHFVLNDITDNFSEITKFRTGLILLEQAIAQAK